jgi:SOUL heme-binding protein
MKKRYYFLFTFIIMITGLSGVGAKEAEYKIVQEDGKFEVRNYSPQILAEVTMDGTFEDAGDEAFDLLYKYISGTNHLRSKIAMTSPVVQQKLGDKWVVSFIMPALYTMKNLPKPKDSRIKLRQIPARRLASIRYSGFWSERAYLKNKSELKLWMKKKGLVGIGEPIWARYNSPYRLWFMRRNEVLIQLATSKNKIKK